MPHLVIEHSLEGHGGYFEVAELMKALHHAAADTGVMLAADIKVRAAPYAHALVAGKPDGFCHVSVYLLEGRTPEQKVALSEAIRSMMYILSPAECISLVQNGEPSKAITPSWSRAVSSSTVALAASLASSILMPPIEPDLSITSRMFTGSN